MKIELSDCTAGKTLCRMCDKPVKSRYIRIEFSSVEKIYFHILCFPDFLTQCKKFIRKEGLKKAEGKKASKKEITLKPVKIKFPLSKKEWEKAWGQS